MIFGSEAKVKCLRVRATPSDAWMPTLKRRRRWRARWRERERGEAVRIESNNNLDIMSNCKQKGNVAQHAWRKNERMKERTKERSSNLIVHCRHGTAETQATRMCKPKDLHRIQVPSPLPNECAVVVFVFRPGPHAELNVVLISRNLCHNYFLIIPHCATGHRRTSLCVCNGLKI